MSETYDAVYAAVRSRLSGCDIGSAVDSALRDAFDFSWQKARIEQDISCAVEEHGRPCMVLRLEAKLVGVSPDVWRVEHGDVRGAGSTPAAAYTAFDQCFYKGTAG